MLAELEATKRRSLVEYAQANLYEGKPASYLNFYEAHFNAIAEQPIKLLELGVANGLSMLMWRDYFSNGSISGIDLFPSGFPANVDDPRIHLYQGRQDDTAFLDSVAAEQAPERFDIIIDDCAHIGELAKISFWHLFEHHLKPGGIYAIEDWGTGYWGNHVYYPDGEYFQPTEHKPALERIAKKLIVAAPVEWPKLGRIAKLLRRHQYTRRFKNHDYGLVGFVKQLIDEIGISDSTNPDHGPPNTTHRLPKISHALFSPGVVLVFKAG